MKKEKEKEHDFSSKLRQVATIRRLKDYIDWQRKVDPKAPERGFPASGPISINLDLTSACNYSCPFCVDTKVTNAGKRFTFDEVSRTMDTLQRHGLLSIILIGGGEPTLHRDFGKIVRLIKSKRLQVGIVTNGSQLEKIESVVDVLEEKDWIRISIDAAEENTFQALHHPREKITLKRILEGARRLKEKNPKISLGYSFVIVWERAEVNGRRLTPNIGEMAGAAELAGEYSFDYLSLKPCLVRWSESEKETLLKGIGKTGEEEIIGKIKEQLKEAKRVAGDRVKVLESLNLKAMLNRETEEIKKQPRRCHMQFFRAVVSPFGIFHCPSLRGVQGARVGDRESFMTDEKFQKCLAQTAESIMTFDAEEECKDVGCFYHDSNWWLEEFIHSGTGINEIEKVENDNFFL